ncbi:peptidoglycan DD-metalloendopeptidase family protein [bacterium]|nr:peptidoglycan DD-metalloendopeptidase family protein [bacterium]
MPFNRYFSVVIIPRKTSTFKKVRIPAFLFGLLGILIVCLISGFVFIVFDYISIRAKLANVEEGEELRQQQQEKIEEFSRQYQELQLHFNHLQSLNKKLKSMVITNIDKEKKSKLREEDAEILKAKIETASRSSILDVIASNTSELDSDLKHEKVLYFKNLIAFFNKQKNPFLRMPSGLPVTGFLINEFGIHVDPYTGQTQPQNGIDVAANLDSPIIAPADGIVLEILDDENYGNMLVIDHGNGFQTRYGHIGSYEVDKGDVVTKGAVIAQVGNTGRTTGPRLYYEVLFNEVPQNPVKYSID